MSITFFFWKVTQLHFNQRLLCLLVKLHAVNLATSTAFLYRKGLGSKGRSMKQINEITCGEEVMRIQSDSAELLVPAE